jgi:hypothetical protein
MDGLGKLGSEEETHDDGNESNPFANITPARKLIKT